MKSTGPKYIEEEQSALYFYRYELLIAVIVIAADVFVWWKFDELVELVLKWSAT